MQDRLNRATIPVQEQVSVGSAAGEIISFSEKHDVSLIIMKATGKRGFLPQILGSTTSRVARDSQKPVLFPANLQAVMNHTRTTCSDCRWHRLK